MIHYYQPIVQLKLSFQDRIERLVIAYIQSHYDVKSMTLEDFIHKVSETMEQLDALVRHQG